MTGTEMTQRWTFSQKMRAGFAFTLALLFLISAVSILSLRSVIQTQQQLSDAYTEDLLTVKTLHTKTHEKEAIYRGFLLTRSWLYIQEAGFVEEDFRRMLNVLKGRMKSPSDQLLLKEVIHADEDHSRYLRRAVNLRKQRKSLRAVSRYFDETVMPEFDRLDLLLNRLANLKQRQLTDAREASSLAASRAQKLILMIAVLALAAAAILGSFLTRTLGRLYGEAQRAVQARDDLMAVVSHDMGNFMTSIQMSSYLLFRKAGQEGQTKLPVSLVETIQTSAQQMNRLIHDLLDLAKLQSGQFSIEPGPDEARHRAEECIRIMKMLAEKKGLALGADLPTGPIEILWDRNRISQVLTNLLANAIKFTPSGGQVSVVLQKSDVEVIIAVTDSGPGIPEHQLPHIFERYWQAKETAKQGCGLGLHIAQEIVQAHGGRIWAQSQLGVGSTFSFAIPLRPDQAEATQAAAVGLRSVFPQIADRDLQRS